MKVGIVSAAMPLDQGPHRTLAIVLDHQLRLLGHAVETVFLPFAGGAETVLEEMAAFQKTEVADYYDRVITLRGPAHFVRHPMKSIWLTDVPPALCDGSQADTSALIRQAEIGALRAAKVLFGLSDDVADQVRRATGLPCAVLAPPPPDQPASWGDVINALLP